MQAISVSPTIPGLQSIKSDCFECDNLLPNDFFLNAINRVAYKGEYKHSYKEKLEIALDYLLFGNYPSLSNIKKVFKGLMIAARRDPELLAYCREAMQHIFNGLHQVLESVERASVQEEMTEIFLKDCLCAYAFLEPYNEENAVLSIPVKQDGNWELVEYTLTPILLTPKWVPDPLYAYGLQAAGYESHLLFMGTPPRAVTGTATAKLVDTIPFGTVGEQLYRWGKEELSSWVDGLGNAPLHIYGKSLGGSMALMAGKDLSSDERIVEVNAFNAPGFFRRESNAKDLAKTTFNVYCAENDPIANLLGYFPENAHIFSIAGERKKLFVHAHNTGVLGFQKLTVSRYSGSQLNDRLVRKISNIAFQILCITVLFPFYTIKFGIRLIQCHVFRPAWEGVKSQAEKIARCAGFSEVRELETIIS